MQIRTRFFDLRILGRATSAVHGMYHRFIYFGLVLILSGAARESRSLKWPSLCINMTPRQRCLSYCTSKVRDIVKSIIVMCSFATWPRRPLVVRAIGCSIIRNVCFIIYLRLENPAHSLRIKLTIVELAKSECLAVAASTERSRRGYSHISHESGHVLCLLSSHAMALGNMPLYAESEI